MRIDFLSQPKFKKNINIIKYRKGMKIEKLKWMNIDDWLNIAGSLFM
jgi:hypothetical protein